MVFCTFFFKFIDDALSLQIAIAKYFILLMVRVIQAPPINIFGRQFYLEVLTLGPCCYALHRFLLTILAHLFGVS